MATTETQLEQIIFNTLSQEKYNELKTNGELNPNEIYLIPDADDVEIPTKVSQLENDAGYLTEHQDISGKADKADTYTKTEVDNLIENFDSLPDQTDNAGKVLTTNGTEASWEEETPSAIFRVW